MDTNKKYILPRTIILAACSLLLAGGCDNNVYDGMERDTPEMEVPLNFNASIEKTEVVQSRSITSTTDFTRNSYSFGMSITKSENGNEIFGGSSDMTAKMERSGSSAPWNWTFINNSDGSGVTPTGPEGKALKVIAYYPCIPANTQSAYTNGIPFDFSSKTDLKQTDLLYNTSTTYPFDHPSGEAVATIPLNFRHAYTWIVLNIRKYMNNNEVFNLSSVTLDNLGGGWIKNKGAIDPATGLAKEGATAGPIGVTLEPVVELLTTDVTYEFLVPSFMDAKVGDGDIVLVLKVNGINETFTLNKNYLNKSEDGKLFGFRQGYKNTYNLVYNNSALSMNVQNWTSEVINGDFGGEIADPPTSDYMWVGLVKNGQTIAWPRGTWPGELYSSDYPPIPEYYNPGEHLYKSYFTTVAYGGNGDYVPVNTPNPETLPTDGMKVSDDINLYAEGKEKVCREIHVTKNDVSILSVPWEDANGRLVAKELCRQYTGGGFKDWRLPRASELRALFLIVAANGGYSDLNFAKPENDKKRYWAGTEVSENEAWTAMCSGYFASSSITDKILVLSPQDKKKKAFVRCVRDFK